MYGVRALGTFAPARHCACFVWPPLVRIAVYAESPQLESEFPLPIVRRRSTSRPCYRDPSARQLAFCHEPGTRKECANSQPYNPIVIVMSDYCNRSSYSDGSAEPCASECFAMSSHQLSGRKASDIYMHIRPSAFTRFLQPGLLLARTYKMWIATPECPPRYQTFTLRLPQVPTRLALFIDRWSLRPPMTQTRSATYSFSVPQVMIQGIDLNMWDFD